LAVGKELEEEIGIGGVEERFFRVLVLVCESRFEEGMEVALTGEEGVEEGGGWF